MSKSLGNIWKAKDALEEFSPEVLRYFFLSAHYRSGLNYDREILEACKKGLEEFNQTFQRIEEALNGPDGAEQQDLLALRLGVEEVEEKFKEAMDDDFNTPRALAALFDLAREVRRVLSQAARPSAGAKSLLGEALKKISQLSGILGINSVERVSVPKEVEDLAQTRIRLKTEKKYKEADEIRAKVFSLGFMIEDMPGGQFRILPKK
jgi:cysteinyl-tRNA synthetase